MKKSQKATNWRNRHVDQIAEKMMRETAVLLSKRLRGFLQMEDFSETELSSLRSSAGE